MTDSAQSPPARTLFYDALYTLAGRILRTVLALALGVLVARTLGPYQRGLYALPTAVYTGLVFAMFTGISLSVSYFMLTANAGREILSPAMAACAIFCAVGAVPVVGAAALGHNAWAAVPAVLLLPPTGAGMLLLGYAIGTKQVRWQTNYSVLSSSAMLVGVGAALLVFDHTAMVAVTALAAVNIIVAAASLYAVFHDARQRPGNAVALQPFLTYALRTGFVNLVTLLNYRADLYIVAVLTTPSILGQYAVAISAAEGLLVITQVTAIVTSPHVGSMGKQDAADMTAACVRATLLIALPICILLCAMAPLIVQAFYGSAYLPLVPALRVLLIAVLILSVASPISNFFTLNRGKPEVALASAIAAAAVCLAISWMLVPRIGMIGAAIATAIAYLLGEGMRMTFFVRATGTPLPLILIPTRDDLVSYVLIARSAALDAGRFFSKLKWAEREP